MPRSRHLWPAIGLTVLCAVGGTAIGADPGGNDILGTWATPNNNGRVVIAPCGARLCGRIVDGDQIRANRGQTDIHNPDPQKRGQAVLGLLVLDGYSGGLTQWRGGTVYDPQTGDLSHDSTLTLVAPDRLKVEGCRWLLCRSELWRRTMR